MKRTFTILMVLMMLLCANAYAETTETADDTDAAMMEIAFDEGSAPYEGDWLTFDDDGFMIYLPSDWVDVDITDEMLEEGTYYAATSEDGAYAMTVSYAEIEDASTNAELAAQLAAYGYENVTELNINGYDVVGYDITEQNVSGIAFLDGAGAVYVFSFTPADDETLTEIGQTILSSLSPIA